MKTGCVIIGDTIKADRQPLRVQLMAHYKDHKMVKSVGIMERYLHWKAATMTISGSKF